MIKSQIWSKQSKNSSVNPQGEVVETSAQQPKTKLENRAKKKNTKM